MPRERGTYNPGLIVTIIIVVLAIIGLFAVCGGNDGDIDTLGRIQLVDHEWDAGWDEDRGGGDGGYSEGHQGYGGGGGRSGDMEQGDGRNCRNFCDNVIYVPDPGGGGGNPEEEPR